MHVPVSLYIAEATVLFISASALALLPVSNFNSNHTQSTSTLRVITADQSPMLFVAEYSIYIDNIYLFLFDSYARFNSFWSDHFSMASYIWLLLLMMFYCFCCSTLIHISRGYPHTNILPRRYIITVARIASHRTVIPYSALEWRIRIHKCLICSRCALQNKPFHINS